MGLFLFRLYVKEFFHIVREYRRSALKKRILVLGIDEQSIAIARAILDNPNLPYHVVGFLTQRTDSKELHCLVSQSMPKKGLKAVQKMILLLMELLS